MVELRETGGFSVADVDGRIVGEVECPLYGSAPDEPDAIAVRGGVLLRRHFLVPALAIEWIDEQNQRVGIGLKQGQLRRFL
jgi:hypothetical protein